MKKILQLCVFSLISVNFAMEYDASQVIKGASYAAVYENETPVIDVASSPSKSVTFYTADGDPITTFERGSHFVIANMLDPEAPKPKPVSYKVKYWPAYRIPVLWGLSTITKGCPGDFIYFYDKNGNQINRYRYNKAEQKIIVFSNEGPRKFNFSDLEALKDFPLDLSQLKK